MNLIKKTLVQKAFFDKAIIKLKKFSLRPVWLNSWVFLYELSHSGFEFRCCHLKSSFTQSLKAHS